MALMLLVVSIVSPLAGGAGAFVIAWLLSLSQFYRGLDTSPGAGLLYLGAALACLLVGPLLWWQIVLRPRSLTPGSGAWVGALSGLAAHPLMWLFALGTTFLIGDKRFIYLGPDELLHFTDALVHIAFFSYYSLVLLGWLTALLGGLAGAGVAWVLARLAARFSRRPSPPLPSG
jgi:hypothetical protein